MRFPPAVALCWTLLMFLGSAAAPRTCAGQTSRAEAQKTPGGFSHLAARLAEQRLRGAEEDEALEEEALALLDGLVLETLSGAGEPNLEAFNRQLATLVSQPSVGEEYRVVRLGGTPGFYALVVNFGLGGPSAVRLYAAAAGRSARTARIDRFAQKNFFDEYLELVPVPGRAGSPSAVFVTVSGRTDELETGSYAAWQFDGKQLRLLWSTELLPRSRYEVGADGFRLSYCAETDEDHPRVCRRMVRERFVWDGAAWKRVEQIQLAVPKQ